ncbi:hypothetical protein OESDEN_01389 [Oesophagostomum dentatum]|uniref:Carboxylesterase type B domain-containing protein n=1 Tax=Oesophagostomum dentatum TaxID=61180 RepID=A0A0B1TTC3_OESDE|nr:hypothetical protein OESDEN_01389 [Oesophagostomum dentatum]
MKNPSFKPFGNPFRSPSIAQPAIPTILGLFRQLPKDYPNDDDFDEKYSYADFKRALVGLVPDSLYKNAPLLRRLVLHQYVYTKGDKKDTYFLFERMRENSVYLFEYGIDNPPKSCLQDGGWEEEIKPFCDRMFQYFTRFAIKGQPTKSGCDPANPTFPAIGSTKRDYHVILKADGVIEWDFNFHLASVQLWNNLLPALDNLELQGRRDAIFKEDVELLPTEAEDDVQEWHQQAAEQGGLDFTSDDSSTHAEL